MATVAHCDLSTVIVSAYERHAQPVRVRPVWRERIVSQRDDEFAAARFSFLL
jgi:hypothetical protein